MKLFEFDSYKDFVTARIKAMPKCGRGQLQKLARHLQVNTSLVSQIFRGDKHLTLEQACAAAEFLGLGEWETDYFVALVEKERAGSRKLRKVVERRLQQIREKATPVGNRLPQSKRLSDADRAVFYSHWYYSAIRILSSIPEHDSLDAIAEYLRLPRHVVGRALEFLLATQLCVEREGRIQMGPARTHLPPDSPLASRHHLNWRVKAMERLPTLTAEEIAFTSPMSIGPETAKYIHNAINTLIEDVSRAIDESPCEQLYCLNLDWVKI